MLQYQDDSEKFKRQFVVGIIIVTFLASIGIVNSEPSFVLAVSGLLILFLIGFLKTELALYLLIFSMLLSPEIGLGGAVGAGQSLEGSRSFIIRLDDIFIVIIGLSWLARTAIHKELGLCLKTPLNKPILYYILISCFATILGVLFDRVNSTMGFFYVLKYVEYFVVYFILVNHLHTEEQFRRYLIAILLTCVIVCIFAIMQIPAGGRVTALFEGKTGEPNTLGGYLVLILSIVSGLILSLKANWERLILAIIAVLIVIPLAYTLSRGSWLAIGPMLLVLFIFTSRKKLLLAIIMLTISLGLLIVPTEVRDRVTYTFTQENMNSVKVGNVALDPSSSARIISWQKVLRDFKNHPLMGYGITGYSFVDSQYFRILIELGALGFLACAYLLFSMLRQIIHTFKQVKNPRHQGFALGMLAGVVAICTHAIGANTFLIIRIMGPFWFLLGIAVVLPKLEGIESEG